MESNTLIRRCAAMSVHRRLLDQVPGYRARRDQLENRMLARKERSRRSSSGQTIIPVVVHVVHSGLMDNISLEQINSQIDVLNQDFQGTNSDTVPAVWQNAIGDASIVFRFAERDPNGADTNGITRTLTNAAGFDDDDTVKFAANGGADAWPADHYLNIWVCHLNNILGYAQFPGGPAQTDGIVIDYRAFGTNGTAMAPFNLGRTATHEVGHWLNLFHIWGDDGTGCSGTDQINDTPNQAGPNTGCPEYPHITCNNGPDGDMFVNFMDYVDDRCMVMFSAGQVDRMHAVLDEARSSFSVETSSPSPAVTNWVHSNLTLATGAPKAAGDPVVGIRLWGLGLMAGLTCSIEEWTNTSMRYWWAATNRSNFGDKPAFYSIPYACSMYVVAIRGIWLTSMVDIRVAH